MKPEIHSGTRRTMNDNFFASSTEPRSVEGLLAAAAALHERLQQQPTKEEAIGLFLLAADLAYEVQSARIRCRRMGLQAHEYGTAKGTVLVRKGRQVLFEISSDGTFRVPSREEALAARREERRAARAAEAAYMRTLERACAILEAGGRLPFCPGQKGGTFAVGGTTVSAVGVCRRLGVAAPTGAARPWDIPGWEWG